MKTIRGFKSSIVVLTMVFMCLAVSAADAALTMTNIHVTDVTPSSFSIIWQTSESASPDIRIFDNAAGSTELTNQLEVTFFPLSAGDPAIVTEYNQDQHKATFRTMLQAKGLMKIRVEGLHPGTVYYCQIFSVGLTETVSWPETELATVTTPVETGFIVENHQLILTVNQPAIEGSLIIVEHPDASHGVSAYMGDGAATTSTVISLANMLTHSGSNWQPTSGEQDILVTVLSGDEGLFSQTITVSFSGNFTVAAITDHLIGFDSNIALTMLEPEDKKYVQEEQILLTWEDTASQVNGSISLYYDIDASGEDGTLITSGIEEDLEGPGDTFLWDTTGVSDGRYFIYGILSDGMITATSYANGSITIDRALTDSDADLIADAWENLYFENLDRTGINDLDNDGASDKDEFDSRTNPTAPDTRISLAAGMNLVSIPLSLNPALYASDLLTALAPSLLSVSRIDPATQTVKMISYNNGNPQGDDFMFIAGAGYTFNMSQPAEKILTGESATDSIDLTAGSNLVGFISPSADYRAYQLLQDIGDDTQVSSIQRFNRSTGLFETVGYHSGVPVGPNFTITRGEGYLITMHQEVTGLKLP